ncbi:MAG: cytidylate kinase-like family protein [Opitutae bacterium]|nr:cytidylate kinase-like family protein [Opitutae bacterium]
MNLHPSLEKATAYLNLQFANHGPGWSGQPEGPFVTLSRESGAGGSTLALALAQQLNAESTDGARWSVYNRNLIETMLQVHHLSPGLARFLPEDRISEVNASMGEILGLHPSLWELVQKTNALMCQLAREGRVIFVGRGANFATAAIAHGVHVRLIAPASHRARRMAQLHGLSEEAAAAYNARQDAARQRYLQANFSAEAGDPTAYDLTINTAQISLEEAAGMICQLVAARTPVHAD